MNANSATEIRPSEEHVLAPVMPGAPPWIWFWALTYLLLALPSLSSLLEGTTGELAAIPATYGPLSFLMYPGVALVSLLPTLAILAGLLTVALPAARAAWVEHRYGLQPLPSLPVCEEIERFVHVYAPDLQLKANLARTDPLAFVYARGYQTSCLAIFAGMLKLWRADRQAAEATLLHEIAHYRRGDDKVVGVGSPFEALIKYGLTYFVVAFLLPLLIILVERTIALVADAQALGVSSGSIGSYVLTQFTAVYLPWIGALLTGYLCRIVSALIVPLLAIWVAELNADQFAVDQQATHAGTQAAMNAFAPRTVWWRRLFFRLSHPPIRLRRWMAGSRHASALLVLVALYPIGYLIQLVTLYGQMLAAYLPQAEMRAQLWGAMTTNTQYWLASHALLWLLVTIALLAWPPLVPQWEWVFSHVRPLRGRMDYRIYAVCAVGAALLCAVGAQLR